MQTLNRNSALYAIRNIWPETSAWLVGLLLLARLESAGDHLFSLCPVSWVWQSGCPGCGLGHSIAYLFRGELIASWQSHPLGVPALLLLIWRVTGLLVHSRKLYLHHSKL